MYSEHILLFLQRNLLNPNVLCSLLERYSTPEKILEASSIELRAVGGELRSKEPMEVEWEKQRPELEAEVAQLNKNEITLIPCTSSLYPIALKDYKNYPLLLYVEGDPTILNQPSIAVIGSRKPTHYGRDMAYSLSQEIAASGYNVISGLALGIDTRAHEGAVSSGKTVAVLGSGLHSVYPKENISLKHTIIYKGGAVISEYPPNAAPSKETFPQRNRIIAGMSKACLLVEGKKNSGSMGAMEWGMRYKRPLYTLPGPVTGGFFSANHQLIKQGKATLIEEATELVGNTYDLFENLFSLGGV